VVQSLTSNEIRTMLEKNMMVTINSDDPGYFRAYLTDNFIALTQEGNFSEEELTQLARNAFDAAWLDDANKAQYQQRISDYVNQ